LQDLRGVVERHARSDRASRWRVGGAERYSGAARDAGHYAPRSRLERAYDGGEFIESATVDAED
jgi:hypothetical protein